MPETLVACGGLSAPGSERRTLTVDVNAPAGSPARVNLRIDDLSSRLADNLPEVLTDLLEIAAYVYCADQFTRRGTTKLPRMGADWRRDFLFRIPVRQLDVWTRPEVHDALCEMLGFLSEDTFAFEFVLITNGQPLQSYLPLDDPSAQNVAPDDVILFSGGLDSLAGAVDSMLGANRSVALVSHRSSTFVTSKQNTLVDALRDRTPPRSLIHVPVTANKGMTEATEFTQRTRSFLFATLAFIVARMFGLNELRFYENGVVSINLPVAGDVVGSRASRTTHPQALDGFQRLFSLLIERPFRVINPYMLKTKGEVVGVLAEHRAADLIRESFSCASVRKATQLRRHCGVCSQCLDRRFGVLAAGLGEHELSTNYAIELFTGAREADAETTMAVSFVDRANQLETMSLTTFRAKYGQVFRALPFLPGNADENLSAIWHLHRRHGAEVVSVFEAELREKATIRDQLSLSAASLLALVIRPTVPLLIRRDPTEDEPPASTQAAADLTDYTSKQIRFAIDDERREVLFEQGICLKNNSYRLVAELAKEFREDMHACRTQEEYRFVAVGDLADRLGKNADEDVRQQVRRVRRALDNEFRGTLGRLLGIDDIIENRQGRGYRLNPGLLLILPQQMQDARPTMSRPLGPNVTLAASGH